MGARRGPDDQQRGPGEPEESTFIPFHRPSMGTAEIEEVVAVLRSGWLTSGPRTARFEQDFSAYLGVPHALAVSSATAGLHLALVALGVGPGDEVITSPLTFCSTVNSILHAGATPVLADVGDDLNIDPHAIEAKLSSRTRAIVPVHLAGLPCDMDAIWALARDRGLWVIEDAAHAVGSTYHENRIGAAREKGCRSDATCFSFYATKNLTTGEGGMVVTDDAALYRRMKTLSLHGIDHGSYDRNNKQAEWFYSVIDCGFKYNMSDIQAAIGIHQLRRLEQFMSVRRQYAEMYDDAFAPVPELLRPARPETDRHCWHLYVLRLNLELLGLDRGRFIEELRDRGVGASVHFIPIPLHPFYRSLAFDPCPRALEQYPRLVSLPIYPAMTIEEVQRVARSVLEIVSLNRSG